MSFRRSSALTLLALVVAAPLAGTQAARDEESESRPEVLILGTYHMANPGRDVHNMEADDVLSERRQAEIAEVMTVLERFRPTRVAVEAGFNSRSLQERYAQYVAGEHELTRSETEQLGFRLARRMGHEAVYPVDVNGEFPYLRVDKFAQATGQAAEFEALEAETGREVAEQGEYQATHTILETLLRMNSDQSSDAGMGRYFQLGEFGEDWDWAGADLLADWFRRNMRIYTNIANLAESPDERILVIYGAGHLGWLRLAFAKNPAFRLRKLDEFAG